MKKVKEALAELYLLKKETEKMISASKSPENASKSENHQEIEEAAEQLIKLIRKESNELYGLFPPKKALDQRLIMIMFEISRIHQR
jgi:hypothetical protein